MPKKGQTYAAIIRKLDSHESMLSAIKETVDEVKANGKDNRRDITENTGRIITLETKDKLEERRIGNNFLIWATIIAGIAGIVSAFITKFI